MQNAAEPRMERGDVVEVRPVHGGYPLPDGLPEGAQVRLVRFAHGYWTVERDGREWSVMMTGVTPPGPRSSMPRSSRAALTARPEPGGEDSPGAWRRGRFA